MKVSMKTLLTCLITLCVFSLMLASVASAQNNDNKSLVKRFFNLLSPDPPDIAGAVQLLDGDEQNNENDKTKCAKDFKKGLPHFTGPNIKDVEGFPRRIDAIGKVKTFEGPIEDIVIHFTIKEGKIKKIVSPKIVNVSNPVRWPPQYQ